MSIPLRSLLILGSLALPLAAQGWHQPPTPIRPYRVPAFVHATPLDDGANPPVNRDGNFILGPTHHTPAYMRTAGKIPSGRVFTFTMLSSQSRLYPGIMRDPGTFGVEDPLHPGRLIVTTSHPAPYTRKVYVYVPSQYRPGVRAPFIVDADGPDPLLFRDLNILIAEHRIPVMIGISVANGGGDAQGSERGLEYDTMSGRYADFIQTEVLPRVEAVAHVRLTRDPSGRAAMGGSSGGACAFIMAWYRPDLFRRVLSYSGTFVNQQWPYNPRTPHGAWEFPQRLIANTPRKPIRVWVEVGDRDLYYPNVMLDGMHDWVVANERMAQALAWRHYHDQFVFALNAGHVDYAVKKQTLPEALQYLWQGYHPR